MTNKTQRPQRTCLGCGVRDDQNKLIRLAAVGNDQLAVEPRLGRGGYLHRDRQCHKAFVGRKGHYRAFHKEISRIVKAKLIEDLAGGNRE